MHDTPDALATANRDIAARLRPVAEKIDAFRRNPTVTIARNELADLQTEIATMKAALGSIRRDGVEVQGGRLLVPTDIVKALEDEVGKVEIQFRTARKEVLETILRNYLQTAAELYSMPGPIEDACSRGSRKTSQMLERRNEFFVALDQLAAAVTDPTKTRADLNALLQNLSQKATRLRLAALETPNVPSPSMQGFNDMVAHIRGVEPMVVEITDIVCRIVNEDRFFTGAEAMSVFDGRVTVSSVVEARVRGLQDSDIDPANEPANIASSRPLGTGSGGTVHELTRTDGTTVVFKGETESRTGLQSLAVGGAGNYAVVQKTINLNFASKKAAEALGMGGMIVRYSAGVHNGVFGFHMEKAKGCTGRDFVAGRSSSSDGLTAKEINKLPAAESRRIKGRIKRELNRLQWLDLVTGQLDRHENNYFIHVDRNTHQVTVTGIDNDAGYSQYRTGAMKFELDEGRTNVFVTQLVATAREIDPAQATPLARRLRMDPGIVKTPSNTLTIDASRIADKTLAYAVTSLTGAQTLAIPDKIDSETYDALVALKEGPQRQAYLDSIRPRLSEASYNAAVSRLDDVIAHAERLRGEKKVIDANAWKDVEETPLTTGKLATRKLDGTEKRLGGTIATEAHKAFCPSIYARDGFEKLFR
ncbi:MAG: hypothetical protein J6Y19_08155 [Kiritimatiellae bacterium]|nr:hypothetical protein [Kiritimatiellia bacterium]